MLCDPPFYTLYIYLQGDSTSLFYQDSDSAMRKLGTNGTDLDVEKVDFYDP